MSTQVGVYELLEPLGAGAMGRVYVARDTRDGSRHALKLLPPDFASDPARVRRFEHEAEAAARVIHPNVLRLREFGEHQGTRFIVSELLEGETLKARLARGRIAARAELFTLAIGLADGLAALHAAGVVHRDLKPENLFVTREGALEILDLGLARVASEERADATLSENGTTPGTILGTAGYMAPEQVRGLPTDARSDVFALGAILYEMAAGARAFPGETALDRALAIVRDPVAPLARPDLPDGFAALVETCLAKDPAARPAGARAVAEALRALAASAETSRTDARDVAAAIRSPARRRSRAVIVGLAWAASVALAIALTHAWSSGARGREGAAAEAPAREAAPLRATGARPSVVLPSDELGDVGGGEATAQEASARQDTANEPEARAAAAREAATAEAVAREAEAAAREALMVEARETQAAAREAATAEALRAAGEAARGGVRGLPNDTAPSGAPPELAPSGPPMGGAVFAPPAPTTVEASPDPTAAAPPAPVRPAGPAPGAPTAPARGPAPAAPAAPAPHPPSLGPAPPAPPEPATAGEAQARAVELDALGRELEAAQRALEALAARERDPHVSAAERAELERAIHARARAIERAREAPPNMLQVIDGAGREVAIDCGDGDAVAIHGRRNTVKISGACRVVSVAGDGNHVTLESSELLVLTGYRTQVVRRSGAATRIIDVGVANEVLPRS